MVNGVCQIRLCNTFGVELLMYLTVTHVHFKVSYKVAKTTSSHLMGSCKFALGEGLLS